MDKSFVKTTFTPMITLLLCCLLYFSGYFQMIFAAIIMIIASAVEHRKDVFRSLGFQRERINIKSLLFIAPLLGVLMFLSSGYVLRPIITHLTGQPIDYSEFARFKGDLPAISTFFLFVWLASAAEEIVFRGYLMLQFTKFFGASKVSLILNILLFGLLFGWVHAYQGITGQILTGCIGLLLAIIFHIRKNDLWFNIVLHGCINTVGLVFMYFGWL